MKKVLSLIVLGMLLFSVGCGCGSDTDEPTPTLEPTPTETEATTTPAPTEPDCKNYYWFDTETTECAQAVLCKDDLYAGLQTFDTLAECQAALPEPEPTGEPTPVAGDSAEEVLASVMDDLIVAFAEVDDEWQILQGPNTLAMNTIRQGGAYYYYASEEVVFLSEGWNAAIGWMGETAAVVDSPIADYESEILIVVGFDNQNKTWMLYSSAVVAELTEIPVGQTYYTFTAAPGNVTGTYEVHTR